MHREVRLPKVWLSFGYSRRFALGFAIDKYGIQIDILCFWIGLEF